MPRLGKILCATDLSPASGPAWQHAQFLAGLVKADLLVLHVVPPLPIPASGYFPPDLYQELVTAGRRDAQEGLDRLLRGAADPGFRATTRIEEGGAAQRILEVAREEAVDLVVMGTHGRTGLGRILLGSVADAVVRSAPCPVITVRADETAPGAVRRIGRICYATDFSPAAGAAWPWVLALAEATGAEVDLVHVTFDVVADRHVSPQTLAAMARMLREQGEAEAERFLEGCPLPRERVHVVVTGGVVGDQIVHQARARSADLVAMGTHGWSGLLRWMLGSVAHQVIQLASCPVLTVGPAEQREERRHGA